MTPIPLKKILIVDDNELFLKLLEKFFRNAGYKCILSNSVAHAFTSLQLEMPDIILSDYEMPGTNGFDFRQQLLANNKFKHIPFVFLTAHTNDKMVLQGLGMQAVDFIDKQTPFPVIVSKLNNIIYTVQQTQEMNTEELKKAANALNIKSAPTVPPVLTGFDVNFIYKPFQDYPGGDFIDFIKVDERYTFVVLGDVMGKKWQAWFFSFGFLSYVRSAIRICILDHEYSPARILQKINTVICYDEVLQNVLSSLSLLMIDCETGHIKYAGAGDLPPLYYNNQEKKVHQLTSTGLLMGLLQDGNYEDQLIEMKTDDKLLLFSDGMTDFTNETGKHSDYQLFVNRMEGYLCKNNTFTAIYDDLFAYFTNLAQVDDCSMIFFQKNNLIK
jgi:sigma-B regulation protein RsbU (phosphoserine phosphatase)